MSKLSLPKKTNKNIELDWEQISYTRPLVKVKTQKGIVVLNVKGIRASDIKNDKVVTEINKLCLGLGNVIEITSCCDILKEAKPVKEVIRNRPINDLVSNFLKLGLNKKSLIKNGTNTLAWFTVS